MKLKNLLEEYYTHISDMQLQYHIDYVGSVNSIDEIRELIDIDELYKFDDELECKEEEHKEEEHEEEEHEDEEHEDEEHEADEIYDKQYFFYICKNVALNVIVVFDYFTRKFITTNLVSN